MSTHRVLLALSLSLLLGCTEQPPARGCSSDAQCPVGARCTRGVCAGDTRPTASLAAIGEVEEYALVALDGSGSSDPEGDLSEHRWSIRAIDAPCAAPEVASREPIAKARFGCPGRYEVTLVVADRLDLPSDPARAEVTVRPSSTAPVVLAGADVGTDHRCGGTPLTCRPTDLVKLLATAPAGSTLRWSVQPPAERPLDAHRRVTFSPGVESPSPTVDIVTDGTAISGDWVFRAEVVDAYGVVGAAHTRVSVRNRPPVVTFVPAGPFEHTFDAQASVFRSQGAVGWSVEDPDGDPIEEVTGLWRHLGDGDQGVFDGDFDGTTVRFTVAVPYAARADAARLRGGDGLLRQIELHAVDSNRTVGSVDVPIVIGNRPPVAASGTVDTSVPHTFDAARSMYVASVRAGTFVDPDGDPIVDSETPGLCGVLHASGNEVTAECAVPFGGVPTLDQLVGTRKFAVAARDPWDAAAVMPYVTVEIGNSPPVFAPTTTPATKCVVREFGGTIYDMTETYIEAPVSFTVEPHASDPDGDPILLEARTANGGSAAPTGEICTGSACPPIAFFEAEDRHSAFAVENGLVDHSALVATDGIVRLEAAVSPAWAVIQSYPVYNAPRACP